MNCDTSVDGSEKTCSSCGSPLPESSAPEPSPENDAIHQLLLNANLLRMRANLDGAITECINALRIDPDNVTAHSLIGDIYREQGKVEEAIRWYRLALDISPTSTRDRARVDELTKDEPQGDTPPSASGWRFGPFALWILVAVVFATIAGSFWMRSRGAQYNIAENPQQSVVDEASHAEMRRGVEPSSPGLSGPAPVKPAAPTGRTDREGSVMGRLNDASVLMSTGLRIVDVSIDPRDDSASITFTSQATPASAEVLVHSSLLVAKEAFQADALLPRLTLRAQSQVADNGELHPRIVFVGEVKKENVESLNLESAHYSDQVGVFDNPWWIPGMETK